MIRATGRLLCWLARRLTYRQRLEASAAAERRRLQRETWRRAGEDLPPKVKAYLEGL